MTDITIQPGNYWFQYNIETSRSVPSNANGWATELRSGQPQGVFYTDIHPETVEDIALSNHAIMVFVVRLSTPRAMSAIDRLVIEAYKRGVDPGISANTLIAQLQSNSSRISFNPFAPYKTITRQFHAVTGTASAEVQRDTTDKLLSSRVIDSNRPSDIGQPTPSVTDAVNAAFGNAARGIEAALDVGAVYKIAAVAVIGVIGFAMVGYGIRSIK